MFPLSKNNSKTIQKLEGMKKIGIQLVVYEFVCNVKLRRDEAMATNNGLRWICALDPLHLCRDEWEWE